MTKKKKKETVRAQTEKCYCTAAACVGAWTLSLINVRALEYFLMHIQAFP